MTLGEIDPTGTVPTSGRSEDDSLLPLAIRQRLWDQVWTRLLALPDAADRAPTSKRHARYEEGQR